MIRIQASPRSEEIHVLIEADTDIVAARRKVRRLATGLGFSPGEATVVATTISELARDIVVCANRGEITLLPVGRGNQKGLAVIRRDEAAGITLDVSLGMRDGYSTLGRLGVDPPGPRRLPDEFQIVSEAGRGILVTVKEETSYRSANGASVQRRWAPSPGWSDEGRQARISGVRKDRARTLRLLVGGAVLTVAAFLLFHLAGLRVRPLAPL